MCFGGGSQKSTSTTKVKLTPEQRELIAIGTPGIRSTIEGVNQGNISLPNVGGFNPAQITGQQMALEAIPQLQGVGSSAGGASQFLTSGAAMFPESNPALQSTIDAATRPIVENATEQLLPSIRSGAVGSGNFGGSRSDVLQQNAVRDVERNIGDVSSRIATEGYQAGLEGLQRGIALTPQAQQSALFPSQVASAVGGQQRGIEEQQAQREFEQTIAPLTFGQQAISSAGALPGAGTTTTSQQPSPGISPLNLLGAGLSLATTPLFGPAAAGTLAGGVSGMFGF